MDISRKEIVITRIEHNTIFTKQKEVILTSDEWKIAINLDLDTYEDIISRLRFELKHICKAKTKFALINEQQQLEILLNKLENAVKSFREILPRVDARPSILNAAGSVFKFVFGTATMADVSKLHNTVQDLHQNRIQLYTQ
jgi:transcriptional regulator with PAS, ATPase and Fis domain